MGDCKGTLSALTALVQQKKHPEWLAKFQTYYQKEVALAASYKIAGRCVSDRNELPDALKGMMNSKGVFLLEVIVTKENNVFPMVPQGYGVSEIRLK